MLKQYYHVDDDGYIIETYVCDDADVPPMYFEGWEGAIEKPRWNFETGQWEESKPLEERLQEAKKRKFAELDTACSAAILGYFKAPVNGVDYEFSFDYEAQSNFIGTMTLFTQGLISEIEWTAWKDGKPNRIKISKEDFLNVAMLGYRHKDDKVTKLRNVLEAQINACQTVEELKNIRWEESEVVSPVEPPESTEPPMETE